MGKNFHESFSESPVQPPSERSTGIIFATVAAIIAVTYWKDPLVLGLALVVATLFLAAALMKPRILRPLNIVWFKFGLLLHRIVNPVIMLLMFVVAIVPAGLIVRIWRDPLRAKHDKDGSTFWVFRDPGSQQTSSMKNQF